MATPNTRSINGATYVPINWNNPEDPGWSEDENSENTSSSSRNSISAFQPKNVYKKAAIFGKLLKDRAKSLMVSKAFREKYFSANSQRLSNEEKEEQEDEDFQRAGGPGLHRAEGQGREEDESEKRPGQRAVRVARRLRLHQGPRRG